MLQRPSSELWRLRECGCTRTPFNPTEAIPDDLSVLARGGERALAACDSGVRPAVPRYGVPWLIVTYDRLRELPLASRDAFVVSLMDGRATVETIVDMAGMPEHETLEILVRLLVLDAIDLR